MTEHVLEAYDRAVGATTNVTFSIGAAQGVIVTVACTGGLTIQTLDGATVDCGAAAAGVRIPVMCTKAVFSAGFVVAYRSNNAVQL